ncbi:hypothetical protein [Leptothoe sp. PORK10 BA2]|uniref:hypothetical protein n=1 Tax=Leptothoe sp. PORK10 BA2 TaxID=3110254 RepID=UPI002B1FF650|nr:hypothetical protein [Leptothoe sp. PORK10 BA2]MEA5462410.1 hypothetical protein [Leptothoe sp. PORK10 BA2]
MTRPRKVMCPTGWLQEGNKFLQANTERRQAVKVPLPPGEGFRVRETPGFEPFLDAAVGGAELLRSRRGVIEIAAWGYCDRNVELLRSRRGVIAIAAWSYCDRNPNGNSNTPVAP